MTKRPVINLSEHTFAASQSKLEADCLDLAAEVLDAAKAEITRLTARVAELEGALGAIADLSSISSAEFKVKHPDLNAMLDKVDQPNWYQELSLFAYYELAAIRAALSTPTGAK